MFMIIVSICHPPQKGRHNCNSFWSSPGEHFPTRAIKRWTPAAKLQERPFLKDLLSEEQLRSETPRIGATEGDFENCWSWSGKNEKDPCPKLCTSPELVSHFFLAFLGSPLFPTNQAKNDTRQKMIFFCWGPSSSQVQTNPIFFSPLEAFVELDSREDLPDPAGCGLVANEREQKRSQRLAPGQFGVKIGGLFFGLVLERLSATRHESRIGASL